MMRRSNALLSLTALFACALPASFAAAQGPRVVVEVLPSQVQVGQVFRIKVTVSQGGRISGPELPEVEGLLIDRKSMMTGVSTRYDSRLGFSKERSWTFNAWAEREGRITIPPLKVVVDGKTLLSKEVQFTASGRASRTPARQRAKKEASVTLDQAFFVEARVNKSTAYQGEQVLLSLTVWALQEAANVRGEPYNKNFLPPAAEGFYVERDPHRSPDGTRERDGMLFGVDEITVALYPTQTGLLTIGPWTWAGTVIYKSNFGMRSAQGERQTAPITVEVLPLPPAPAKFSGTVGRFEITAHIKNATLVQGVPAPFTVVIKGKGNPDAIGAPSLPAIAWAHVGDPKVSTRYERGGGERHVVREYSYDFTPLETGAHETPELLYTYFSPETKRYESEVLRPIRVQVQATGESQSLVVAGGARDERSGEIKLLGGGILPIIAVSRGLAARNPLGPATAASIALPPIAYAIFLLAVRRRRRFSEDPDFARGHFARSKGEKRLSGLAGSAEPAEEMYKALAGYLADKFSVNAAGLTSNEAREVLEGRGVEQGLCDNIVRVLRACERSRYAREALSAEEVQALKRGAIAAMDDLDALLRNRRKK